MNRIAISMRMMRDEQTGEWRDALAQDWSNYLHGQNVEMICVPNNPENCATHLKNADALILSGGDDIVLQSPDDENDNPMARRDRTEYALLQKAIELNVPVLGVCRGMQLINYFFDGTLKPVSSHVAKDHEVQLTDNPLFSENMLQVNSFHNQGIDALGKGLTAFAVDDTETVEAFAHESKPVFGIMWHPERPLAKESEAAHKTLIANLLNSAS